MPILALGLGCQTFSEGRHFGSGDREDFQSQNSQYMKR